MTLPVLTVGVDDATAVLAALRDHGAALVRDPAVPAERFDEVLRDAVAYFDLPEPARAALDIERSPHFRGASVMHNERDWREQLHLGRELPAVEREEPFWRLQGPNLWPEEPGWRERVSAWMAVTERVGRRILDEIGRSLGVADPSVWVGEIRTW